METTARFPPRIGLALACLLAATAAAQEKARFGPYADLQLAGQMIEIGQHAEAEKLLAVLVEQIPESAQAWYRLALVRSPRGDRPRAREALREALALADDWPQAHLLAAELPLEDTPEQAAVHARRAAELAPGQHAVLRRAVRVGLRCGDTEGCDRLVEQVVAAAPDDPETYYLAADLALHRGDREKAVAAYRKLTDLQPGDPFAWESLARLHVTLSQPKEALAAFERALQIHPSDVAIRQQVIDLMLRLRVPAADVAAQRKYLRYYEWARAQAAKPQPQGK